MHVNVAESLDLDAQSQSVHTCLFQHALWTPYCGIIGCLLASQHEGFARSGRRFRGMLARERERSYFCDCLYAWLTYWRTCSQLQRGHRFPYQYPSSQSFCTRMSCHFVLTCLKPSPSHRVTKLLKIDFRLTDVILIALTRRMVDSTQLTPPPLPSRLRPEQPSRKVLAKPSPLSWSLGWSPIMQ